MLFWVLSVAAIAHIYNEMVTSGVLA